MKTLDRLDQQSDSAEQLVTRTKVFTLAESLGAVESLIEHPASMTHVVVEGTPLQVDPGLVRLSVGLESLRDLADDLCQALDSLTWSGPEREARRRTPPGAGRDARGAAVGDALGIGITALPFQLTGGPTARRPSISTGQEERGEQGTGEHDPGGDEHGGGHRTDVGVARGIGQLTAAGARGRCRRGGHHSASCGQRPRVTRADR